MTTTTADTFLTRSARLPRELELSLIVKDAEVIEDLAPILDEDERRDVASTALRVGVIALRKARGEIDAHRIRHEGDRLLQELRDSFAMQSQHMNSLMTDALRRYFDPESGSLPLRLERLVADDGELTGVLRDILTGPQSDLCRTLSAQLGAQSPLMRMLDPTQAASLDNRVRELLAKGVAEQKQGVLAEFSLDNKASALSRLLAELTDNNGTLRKEFREDLSKVVSQFSLDDKDSALSRLVERVNGTQDTLLKQFSLDSEQSVLARIKKELHGHMESLVKSQADFQVEIRETLARLESKKQADHASPQHGDDFEVALGRILRREADKTADIFEAVGNGTGMIKHCKKGDFVLTMGPEHAQAGRRIAVEAKANQSYSDKEALVELDEARKNRGADIGIFVFSRGTAGEREAFRRIGDDILVVWDEEDPSTNIYIHAAVSVARALIVKRSRPEKMDDVDLEGMEASVAEIEKQLEKLDTIHNAGESIRKQVDAIQASTKKMREAVGKQIGALRDHVDTVTEALTET